MAEISLQDHSFEPDNIHVATGEEVIFRNDSTDNHTVTADDGSFDSGDLAPGDTYHYTFDSPGECSYHCDYHPGMVGNIVIE